MKIIFLLLTITLSLNAFAQEAYVVERNRWGGDDVVRFPGVSGDLFATHEFIATRGPGWKRVAEDFIEEETDAVEISGKIEDGTISDHCKAHWESVDYVELEGISLKWSALKPIRNTRTTTILYTVAAYGDYIIKMENGRKIKCPYPLNTYVFLNKKSHQYPFTYIGIIE